MPSDLLLLARRVLIACVIAVMPPAIGLVIAQCPHTVQTGQVCEDGPASVDCPATSNACSTKVYIEHHAGEFGCKVKSSQEKQCIAAIAEELCYVDGKCRLKTGTTNECEKDSDAGEQEHKTVPKRTVGC
jgi:hypothetical protein